MSKREPLYPHVPKNDVLMYHLTSMKNLNGILSTGLRLGFRYFAKYRGGKGVYLAKSPIYSLNVLRHTLEDEPALAGYYALLEVRVNRADLAPDLDYPSRPPVAFISRTEIPPENIRHIASFEGDSKNGIAFIRQTWGEKLKPMPFFVYRR